MLSSFLFLVFGGFRGSVDGEESHGCLGELKDRSLRLEEALDSRLLALKQERSLFSRPSDVLGAE